MSEILCWVLLAYQLIVLVYILDSWVPQPPTAIQPVLRFARAAVDPVLAPLRRVLPPLQLGRAAFDMAVLILIFVLFILQAVIC